MRIPQNWGAIRDSSHSSNIRKSFLAKEKKCRCNYQVCYFSQPEHYIIDTLSLGQTSQSHLISNKQPFNAPFEDGFRA